MAPAGPAQAQECPWQQQYASRGEPQRSEARVRPGHPCAVPAPVRSWAPGPTELAGAASYEYSAQCTAAASGRRRGRHAHGGCLGMYISIALFLYGPCQCWSKHNARGIKATSCLHNILAIENLSHEVYYPPRVMQTNCKCMRGVDKINIASTCVPALTSVTFAFTWCSAFSMTNVAFSMTNVNTLSTTQRSSNSADNSLTKYLAHAPTLAAQLHPCVALIYLIDSMQRAVLSTCKNITFNHQTMDLCDLKQNTTCSLFPSAASTTRMNGFETIHHNAVIELHACTHGTI